MPKLDNEADIHSHHQTMHRDVKSNNALTCWKKLLSDPLFPPELKIFFWN